MVMVADLSPLFAIAFLRAFTHDDELANPVVPHE